MYNVKINLSFYLFLQVFHVILSIDFQDNLGKIVIL